MRTFKVILSALVLAASVTVPAFAQKNAYKVEESSAKRVPEWVNAVEKDFLNVTAVAGDIEAAKAAVIENVKKQIAQSIATRIVSESSLSTSALQTGDSFSRTQSIESSILSRTAKLPFIGEISLSKAADYYWEKRYYKSSGRYEYFYAVKYPFSEFEMKELVLEYQSHDRSLNEKLEQFRSDIDFVSSIEQIGETLNELRAFLSEFDIQDPRYDQVQSLSNQYRQLYDQITVDWFQEKKGMVVVNLSLTGRSISTSQRPQIKSNCASQISSSYEGNSLIIKYNDEYCYEDDHNSIEVRFRAGNKYISETIYFKNNVDISLTGIVSDAAGQPLQYARLTLIPGGKTVTTGRNGLYVFNDIASGNYSVQAMKKGYLSSEIAVQVTSGATTRADISLSPDPSATVQSQTPAPAQNTVPADQTAQTPNAQGPDPLNTVRNGLAAYFRFNGNTRSEVSAIIGNPVNNPQYTTGADGTQAISLSSVDGSQISFPKTLISYPNKNFSVTFWMKGFSDGHVWSMACGDSRYNQPKLTIKDGKFFIYNSSNYTGSAFTHPQLDYNWHFIAVVIRSEGNNVIGSLYIDGVLVDSIKLYGFTNRACTKFLLGGASESDDNAIDTNFDNLRIYSSKALSDQEVAEIYMSER